MQKNERLVIEKAANGFIVRGETDRNCVVAPESFMVFNDMGIATATREGQASHETLLGFLAQHFEG